MRVGVAVWLAICLLFWTCGVSAQEETSVRAAAILELNTGRVLIAVRENERLPMASTTKVMTALLALERGRLDEAVTAGPNAYGVPGTSIYLAQGETLTLEEMLYGLMLASGNDAAVAIAEHFGETVEGFAEMMNARAAALGATNTHFVTPHGLPADGHYTSALDLARIACQAMRIPAFREIVSTQRASIPWEGREYGRVLRNKNRLLSEYPGATGIKTGYTRAAGRCLVFGARREGLELVGVVLGCGEWFDEAARLMDRAFARYTWAEALRDGADCGQIPVLEGETPFVRVCAMGALGAPLDLDETPEVVLELPDVVRAPLPSGAMVGRALLRVDGETLAQVPLVLAEPARAPEGVFDRISRCWLLR